ncbi:hypothetical protein AVEN_221377-1 [Araneus ventricosus]|uniref:BED-type domain-containing protein n=1 Tax=Araneus ventricosus TaxID=182803 RepID=A0A4Y2KTA9_ARAVE|nr:hypothetical protein AVEN_221377-1 [Araneus ventricosus]
MTREDVLWEHTHYSTLCADRKNFVTVAKGATPQDAEKNVDDSSADALTLQPLNQSTISDVEEGSEGETSEEVNEIRKNASGAGSSDQTSGLRRSKRIKTDHSLPADNQVMKTELKDVSINENLQSSQDQNSVLEDNTVTGERKRMGPRSSVWKMFTKLENGCSRCKICGMTMSKKSYVSNLLRHMKRVHPSSESAMQRKIAESEVPSRNQLPDMLHGETGRALPIIHTFERETKVTSTHSDQKTDECQTACSSSDATGCLLSERLVHAVEEGNHLLRSLQNAVERQGEALNRLVACLEGMNQVQKNNV